MTERAVPPFHIIEPHGIHRPVIVASPHSGRNYMPEFLRLSRLGALALRRSEDCYVEQLFEAAPRQGATLLHATFPRAYCDVNREAWELDPTMFREPLPAWCNTTSRKVKAGFGTIARIVSRDGPIYARPLPFDEAEKRIRTCWRPYHDALAHLVHDSVARHGFCLLLDAHSMPAVKGRGEQPDFVLGNAWGTACTQQMTALVEHVLTGHGYSVARNVPFAGGYVTRHYGQPRRGVQALQLEMSRALYMDQDSLQPHEGFARLQSVLMEVVAMLAQYGDMLAQMAAE
ncbi:N-formylglutamate amidohydrolase [Komagataeibacter sucrofermentans]|uniref:N-formylglutamate amidohydrolase n=1 Tax=Komagataeibacter sucrofermentans TaxID=1053551 RepID=A0A318QHW9_9PROT|nr:N-formylglutamate amidohydrolase [Komagataeibacter sucrofermentans]PYD77504.1 N-formylglutamate amidohydrolase [Komagataeibacter sucrofermentans]GBQ50812.1 N-formylglutamate amidohydrolase [Komagataeibacter sucrofermentans DSM 15973]